MSIDLLAELSHIVLNTRQVETQTLSDKQYKPTALEPRKPSWIEIGQKNIHLYQQLTQRYKTLATNSQSSNQNDEAVMFALQNIIEHLENMRYFYETSPLKPGVKNEFLQQNQTRHAEWSGLLSKWETTNEQPVHLEPDQEPIQITVTPAVPIQQTSASIQQNPDRGNTKEKQLPPLNSKQDQPEYFDQYELLELSLGLREK